MIEQTIKEYDIDLYSSFMVGDKQSDIDFAINAKIKNSIYVGDNQHIKNYTYSFRSIIEAKNYLKVIIDG
jgi:D-glycero-D-manno-heptose 1,7-bisphosphate phosphatase